MFRLTAPVVIWWIWLVFAVANVIDLGLEAQPRFAAMVSVVLLTITGVAYACAFRPRVVADEGGLLVVNPVRQWRVPWAAIRQIEVRDWVRIQCARAPGGDATKTIECWALFATARVKRNYSRRAQDHITRSADTARMPDEARRLMSLPTVVIIARQLERRAGQAQAHSATDHRATDHRATDHRATDHRATDHRATDHRATDHRATNHRATDHRATDHRATDHRATDDRHRGWSPPGPGRRSPRCSSRRQPWPPSCSPGTNPRAVKLRFVAGCQGGGEDSDGDGGLAGGAVDHALGVRRGTDLSTAGPCGRCGPTR